MTEDTGRSSCERSCLKCDVWQECGVVRGWVGLEVLIRGTMNTSAQSSMGFQKYQHLPRIVFHCDWPPINIKIPLCLVAGISLVFSYSTYFYSIGWESCLQTILAERKWSLHLTIRTKRPRKGFCVIEQLHKSQETENVATYPISRQATSVWKKKTTNCRNVTNSWKHSYSWWVHSSWRWANCPWVWKAFAIQHGSQRGVQQLQQQQQHLPQHNVFILDLRNPPSKAYNPYSHPMESLLSMNCLLLLWCISFSLQRRLFQHHKNN